MNHPKYARLVRSSVEPQNKTTSLSKHRGIPFISQLISRLQSLVRRRLFLKPKFLRRAFAIVILLVTVSWSFQYWIPSSEAFAAPWSPTHGSYGQRKQLTLVNNSGQTFESGTTYKITIDTASLYNTGSLLSTCDDLRVVYQPSNTTAIELKRAVEYASGSSGVTTCGTSSATKVVFQLQASLANSATDANYYLYYDNAQASAYSSSDALDAYNVGSKEATFVAPFNGTTTALAAGSGTPTTATGAIRYSGGKSAMSFDGLNDYISVPALTDSDGTIEFWFYQKGSPTSGVGDMFFNKYSSLPLDGLYIVINPDSRVDVGYNWGIVIDSSTSVAYNQWNHLALSFGASGMQLFINGVAAGSSVLVAGLDDLSQNTMTIGNSNASGTNGGNALIDEVRISNTVRYTSNFTPQTTPFVRDEYTKLLYHFDENGDDPRNTGKAIDDSGNGNHGTITGAKYVGGLVGMDSGSGSGMTGVGYQSSQAYAGHDGVFIEEGTTNKISNPSFENSIYDKNWSTNTGTTLPTTIATSTETRATTYNRSRKTWWDGTRYWASFDNGNDIVFYYSTDGTSWTQNTSATITGKDYTYTIWGDATDLYIAYVISLDVRVRKATSYPGTSFAWGTEYTAFDGTGPTDNHFLGGLTKDTSGYLWVSTVHYDGANGQIYVKRSTSANDVSGWNSTVQLSSSSGFTQQTNIVPLNNGDVYALFSMTGATTLFGCYFDSQGNNRWEDSSGNDCTNGANHDTIGTDLNIGTYGFSSTVDPINYDIHVVGRKSSGTGLSYIRWDNGTGTNGTWQSKNDTGGAVSNENYSMSVDFDTGDLFLTYINTEPYLITCDKSLATSECSTAGDWSSATDLGTLTSGSYVNSNFGAASRTFAIWRDNSGSPYDVEFVSYRYAAASANTTASYYKFGFQSVKINATSTVAEFSTSVNAGNTNTHTLSAYVYNGTSGAVGGTIDGTVAKLVFNSTAQTTTYTDMGGGWWRLSYSAAAGTGLQDYGVEAQSGKIIYVDGVQLEEKVYATTYTDGTMGIGYAWTGTAHDSTSTRTGGDVQFAQSANIDPQNGSISFWFSPVKSKREYSSGSFTMGLWSWTNGSNKYDIRYFDNTGTGGSTCNFQFNKSISSVNYTASGPLCITFTKNAWYHITATWSSITGSSIYVNTVTGTPHANTSAMSSAGSMSFVGNHNSFLSHDGLISDVKIFGNSLSSSEIADLYYAGLGSQTSLAPVATERYTDGEPPVLAWHLNEGYGTTAYDSTINQNAGTISGATWSDDSGQAGMTSKSLKFDGSNDFVSRTYTNDSELAPGTSPFSVSTWFKHPSTVTGTDTLISRYSSTGSGGGYKVYMNSSGYICFGIDDDTTWGPDDSACTTVSYADSNWHHVLAIKGTSTIAVYIDGVQKASTTLTTTNSLTGSSPAFYVGIDSDGASNPWDGFIDEVRVYNSARSEEQINQEYISKGTNKGINVILGSGATPESLSNGLVGHWKMDEPSWSGAAGEVLDSSGNSNNGVRSGDATTATGKYGNGGTFDGTGDYTNQGSSSLYNFTTSDFSISMWIKSDTLTSGPVVLERGGYAFNAGYALQITSRGAGMKAEFSINSSYSCASTTTIANGQWYLVTAVKNGNKAQIYINGELENSQNYPNPSSYAGNLRFGSNLGTQYFYDGSMDEVRIYNRALSTAEVRSLYEYAPGPVAHWTMDEGSGQSAYDKSGNSNTGTLGASSSVGSDDPQWINGKYGKGLSFDGTSDYLQSTNSIGITSASPRTLEFWTYINTISDQPLVGWGSGSSSGNIFQPLIWGGKYYLHLLNTDWNTNITPQNNSWTHHSITYDGATVRWYLNGVDIATPVARTLTTGNSTILFGKKVSGTTAWFNGAIDDVRIYNYARTQKQIVQDMNAGHPAVGSPVGSAVVHYKFDEGQGTVARNSGNGGSALNGTLTNMSALATATSGWTNEGKFSKALNFDGSNDYVSVPGGGGLNNQQEATISLWVKWIGTQPSNYFSVYGPVTARQKGGYFSNQIIGLNGADPATAKIIWRPYSGFNTSITSSSSPGDSVWRHVLITYSNGNHKIYLDGQINGQAATTGTINDDSSIPFAVGGWISDVAKYSSSSIDEVKIYNYALSEDEVKLEYNQGKAIVMGSLGTTTDGKTTSNAQSRAYCPPGNVEGNCAPGQNPAPVAEWKFDEGLGTLANDTSGNANTGTLTNGPLWKPGKFGSALFFDGAGGLAQDDNVNAGSNTSIDEIFDGGGTISFWIKPGAGGGYAVYTKSGSTGYHIGPETCDENTVDLTMRMWGNAGQATWRKLCILNVNQWNYVSVAYNDDSIANDPTFYVNGVAIHSSSFDTDNNPTDTNIPSYAAATVNLGNNGGTGALDGLLDNVRFYTYAQTPAQIAWDYNKGAPLVQYKFNECNGTTINNSVQSANGEEAGNNVTLTIGASGSQSAVGTCASGNTTEAWNNGTTGKISSSISFDGTDDYAQTGDLSFNIYGTAPYSQSVWVKTSIKPTGGNYKSITMTTETGQGSTTHDKGFVISSSGYASFYNWTGSQNFTTGLTDITDNSWHHLTATYDGANCRIYVDGKLEKTQVVASTYQFTSPQLVMSFNNIFNFQYYSGQIDDVRIYNYALSPVQVKDVYNNGAVSFK